MPARAGHERASQEAAMVRPRQPAGHHRMGGYAIFPPEQDVAAVEAVKPAVQASAAPIQASWLETAAYLGLKGGKPRSRPRT